MLRKTASSFSITDNRKNDNFPNRKLSFIIWKGEPFRYPTYLLDFAVFIEDIKSRLSSRQSVIKELDISSLYDSSFQQGKLTLIIHYSSAERLHY